MEYTLLEIKKYKNNLKTLIEKLVNIIDINEEISINNEIKNTSDFLSSLLNIKKNLTNKKDNPTVLSNQNIINNEEIQQDAAPEISSFHIILQNEEKNKNNDLEKKYLSNFDIRQIKVIFRQANGRFASNVYCLPDEKIANVIDKYRNRSGDFNPHRRFIFNSKDLPQELTVSEVGITNNSNSFIVNTCNINQDIFK